MTAAFDWTGGRSKFPQVMFKRVFTPLQRPVAPGAAIVTAYTDGQVTLRSNRAKIGYHEAANTSTYKGVEPGDFVVHGLDILRGSVGVSDSRGAISSVCTVCRPAPHVDAHFMAFALRAQAAAGVPRAMARGVREGGADFRRWDTLGELPVPLPPLDQQRRIAAFLVQQIAALDRAVRVRDRQISLLKERFAARLFELQDAALRRGFVDTPLKYLAKVVDTEHKTAPGVPDGGYWVAGTGAIRSGRLVRDRLYETDAVSFAEWTQRGTPSPGDVVLTREAPVGEVALLSHGDAGICIGQRVVLIQPGPRLVPEHLLYTLLSPRTQEFYDDVTQGSLHPHLNMRDIGSIRIPVSSLEDQRSMSESMSREFENQHSQLLLLRRSVELIRERKNALITHAVTGEFKVPAERSAA